MSENNFIADAETLRRGLTLMIRTAVIYSSSDSSKRKSHSDIEDIPSFQSLVFSISFSSR